MYGHKRFGPICVGFSSSEIGLPLYLDWHARLLHLGPFWIMYNTKDH